MTPAIAMLIVQYGVPVAMQIWNTIDEAVKKRGGPDAQMWSTLMEIVPADTVKTTVKAELVAAGVPTPGPTLAPVPIS